MVDFLKQGGDAAELRAHAGFGDHSLSPSAADERSPIGHVAPVAQRKVGLNEGIRCFPDGFRFPGEGRFVGLETGALEQAAIGGDEIPGFEQDDISWNQQRRGQLTHRAVAADENGGNSQLGESSDRLFRPVFLSEAECGIQDHDNANGCSVLIIAKKR